MKKVLLLIVIAVLCVGCGFPTETRETCGIITKIQEGVFQVHFKPGYNTWFKSDNVDTLRIGQTVCLK